MANELETLEKERAEQNTIIDTNMGSFTTLKQQLVNDPRREEYFKSLDFALTKYAELMTLLTQGCEFYRKLNEYLNKLLMK